MLRIVRYPHPILRYRSRPVLRINRQLRELAAEMLTLMYEAEGIGLAANQVDLPLRMFVMNTAGKKGEGEERVYINPVISRPRGNEVQEEGCLSLPKIYAEVLRPERISVVAYDLQGEEIKEDLAGLHARVVQHEVDHLDGVLFMDRIDDGAMSQLEGPLAELSKEFEAARDRGEIARVPELEARRQEWERQFT